MFCGCLSERCKCIRCGQDRCADWCLNGKLFFTLISYDLPLMFSLIPSSEFHESCMLKQVPESFPLQTGVVEYLSNGIVADNHKDFKELRYNECLMNFSGSGKNGASEGRITHGFQLKSAYENNLMPYTNYTFDFKVSSDFSEMAGIDLVSPGCCLNFLTISLCSRKCFITGSYTCWTLSSHPKVLDLLAFVSF